MRVAVLIVLLVAFGACTRSSPSPTPSASAAPSASAEASASPSSSPGPSASSAPGVPRCHTADLSASVGPTSGAAGTTYVEIDFTNSSSAPCTLKGYPGVSLVDASGSQLGQPATRDSGGTSTLVTLAGGGKAHTSVGFPNPDNFSSGTCTADAANMRVYPPDETQSLLVAVKRPWCPGFSVRPISAE